MYKYLKYKNKYLDYKNKELIGSGGIFFYTIIIHLTDSNILSSELIQNYKANYNLIDYIPNTNIENIIKIILENSKNNIIIIVESNFLILIKSIINRLLSNVKNITIVNYLNGIYQSSDFNNKFIPEDSKFEYIINLVIDMNDLKLEDFINYRYSTDKTYLIRKEVNIKNWLEKYFNKLWCNFILFKQFAGTCYKNSSINVVLNGIIGIYLLYKYNTYLKIKPTLQKEFGKYINFNDSNKLEELKKFNTNFDSIDTYQKNLIKFIQEFQNSKNEKFIDIVRKYINTFFLKVLFDYVKLFIIDRVKLLDKDGDILGELSFHILASRCILSPIPPIIDTIEKINEMFVNIKAKYNVCTKLKNYDRDIGQLNMDITFYILYIISTLELFKKDFNFLFDFQHEKKYFTNNIVILLHPTHKFDINNYKLCSSMIFLPYKKFNISNNNHIIIGLECNEYYTYNSHHTTYSSPYPSSTTIPYELDETHTKAGIRYVDWTKFDQNEIKFIALIYVKKEFYNELKEFYKSYIDELSTIKILNLSKEDYILKILTKIEDKIVSLKLKNLNKELQKQKLKTQELHKQKLKTQELQKQKLKIQELKTQELQKQKLKIQELQKQEIKQKQELIKTPEDLKQKRLQIQEEQIRLLEQEQKTSYYSLYYK